MSLCVALFLEIYEGRAVLEYGPLHCLFDLAVNFTTYSPQGGHLRGIGRAIYYPYRALVNTLDKYVLLYIKSSILYVKYVISNRIYIISTSTYHIQTFLKISLRVWAVVFER